MIAELAKHQKTSIKTDTKIFFHVSMRSNENIRSVNEDIGKQKNSYNTGM